MADATKPVDLVDEKKEDKIDAEVDNALLDEIDAAKKDVEAAADAEAADALFADELIGGIVPTTDDPTTTHLSFRVWVLGTIWCIGMAAANAILSFRTNSFSLSSLLAALVVYPMGIGMAKITPKWSFKVFGQEYSLNPGPFTIKEHVLIYVIASAGSAGVYACYNVVAQRLDLLMANPNIDFVQSLFWVLTTQFIGFGIAGMCRRFLVRPKAMMWPTSMADIALYVSLHKPDPKIGKYKTSRFVFFWVALGVIFLYELIPNIFVQALQSIALLCLFAMGSKNSVARFLGSTAPPYSGPGLLSLTFDLQYIGAGAFLVPFTYILQSNIGYAILTYIVGVYFYYANPFGHPPQGYGGDTDYIYDSNGTERYPFFNNVNLYNKNGIYIRARDLYQKPDYTLNVTKFEKVGPIYLSDYFAISYLCQFMTLPAMVTHVALWYGPDIWRQFKNALKQMDDEVDKNDIHNKLMKAYKDIPEWMYLAWLAFWTVALCLVVQFTEFRMPIWGVLLAAGVAMVLTIPIGIVTAITGTQIGLNVLEQLIAGLIMPGNTIAVMAFKSVGFNTAAQAITLIYDLKIGHYLKIPPISMVAAQIYGTFIGSIVYLGFCWWMMFQKGIKLGVGDWIPTGYTTFYNAGAIWGAIGPVRFFGIGSKYEGLLYGWLIGFLAPFLPWLANKVYPNKFWHQINMPVILYNGYAGYYQNFVLMQTIISYIFMNFLKRRANDWWTKYNYVLGAAVSGAVAAAVLFATGLQSGGVVFPVWSLSPDLANGANVDYYCWGEDYFVPTEE